MYSMFFLIISLALIANAGTKVKVGASPALSTAGVYIAKERGYFRDLGLDVEIVVMNASTSQMTGLIAKNELQVGAGNLTAGLYNAWASGEKFKIVADKGHLSENAQYIWLLLRSDLIKSGKVKSVKDLKSLKIGLPSVDGASQQVVLDRILKSEGLSLKDVELMKIGYPEMNLALKSGAIDGAIQLEPFLYRAVEEGFAVKFSSAQRYHPNQQSAVLVFSEAFASQNNKIDGKNFIKAYLKGVQDYNSSLVSSDKWLALTNIINSYSKIEGDTSWKKVEPVGLSLDGSLDIKSMKNDLEWYIQNGYLKAKIDLDAVVDLSYAISSLPKKE